MNVTSNFNFQKKDYGEVRPHDDRQKSKTKNSNIDWRYTNYDVLGQHPINYDQLMDKQWTTYVKRHNAKYQKYHRNLRYKSVKDMLRRRKKSPYRTFVMGFGDGATRSAYYHQIAKAYPDVSKSKIMKIEAKGLIYSIDSFNSFFSGLKITDYSVHVDEIKQHIGQVHAQGRVALLGHTAKGKPSMSLNSAVKRSVFDMDLSKSPKFAKIFQHYTHRKLDLKNNRSRFSLLRFYIDYMTFTSVSSMLKHYYPKADLNFKFERKHTKSVSHSEYERSQDLKFAKSASASASKILKSARATSLNVLSYASSYTSSYASNNASSYISALKDKAHSYVNNSFGKTINSIDTAKTSIRNADVSLATRAKSAISLQDDNEKALTILLPKKMVSSASQLLSRGISDKSLGVPTDDTTKHSGTDLIIHAFGAALLTGRLKSNAVDAVNGLYKPRSSYSSVAHIRTYSGAVTKSGSASSSSDLSSDSGSDSGFGR